MGEKKERKNVRCEKNSKLIYQQMNELNLLINKKYKLLQKRKNNCVN